MNAATAQMVNLHFLILDNIKIKLFVFNIQLYYMYEQLFCVFNNFLYFSGYIDRSR